MTIETARADEIVIKERIETLKHSLSQAEMMLFNVQEVIKSYSIHKPECKFHRRAQDQD